MQLSDSGATPQTLSYGTFADLSVAATVKYMPA
jgi:hypothetical protein